MCVEWTISISDLYLDKPNVRAQDNLAKIN